MTHNPVNGDPKTNASATGKAPARITQKSQRPKLLQLPGLLAVDLYMLLSAVIVCINVAHGQVESFYLIFSVLFIAAALGLLLLLRWAWALTLAAVAMMSGLFLWTYTTQHLTASLVQGLLNLIFFLYLVRTDIRNKLH